MENITPGERIRRIRGRMANRRANRRGGRGQNVSNPRNILGMPKRKFYTNKVNGNPIVPKTREDFQVQDLQRVAYQMERVGKEVAELMHRKDEGKKYSNAKLTRLIAKGNMLANKHNNLVDKYGGNLSGHVTFYDKDGEGVVNEYFDMLSGEQRLSSDKTGYSEGEAKKKLDSRVKLYSKDIPNLVNEQNLPQPQLIRRVM
jgi:hypothetical protein